MICIQVDTLAGLSKPMAMAFAGVKRLMNEASLSMVVHKFYNGKEVMSQKAYPVYGFYIANTRFYSRRFLAEVKRTLPKSARMEVTDLTITFYEIDKTTRGPKR